MSLSNLANMCSHLQNASRARLSQTSTVMTKMHLAICLSMQKHGLFSTVQVAGQSPPKPTEEMGFTEQQRQELEVLIEDQPWLAYGYNPDQSDGGKATKDRTQRLLNNTRSMAKLTTKAFQEGVRIPGVPDNPAQRRIWLGLKYYNNEPILRDMHLISTPKRRITAQLPELLQLVQGRHIRNVKGIVNPGELIFVGTDIGVMEAREAIERRRGGMLLVRAGS